MADYTPAKHPTLYFIGVTTGSSSIMRVFPAWAEYLGLADAAIVGLDFPLHAEPARYREAVTFIKHDPLSRGALVTTHKIDLFDSCRDLFDSIDPHAQLMQETSCISKSGSGLVAHAKDPISAGLTLDGFLPADHFARTGAELFVIGAGGSATAITWHLMCKSRGRNAPRRIVVADRSPERLAAIREFHRNIATDAALEYVDATPPSANDAVLKQLDPGALVINATGLGKDAPGSPLSDAARFPERAIVWELNYRGDLVFLEQARAQQTDRHLQIENGWTYFIHGWAQVIAEVFGIEIPASGPRFETLARIAAES